MVQDLPSLFAQLQRILIDIDDCLESCTKNANVANKQRLASLLETLERTVECMAGQPAPSHVWTQRISKANEDLESARTNVARVLGRRTAREEEELRRLKLFGSKERRDGGDDHLMKERGSLLASHSAMDELIDQGRSSLQSILDQNAIVKGAKGRLLTLLNATGLSSALSSKIGSRERMDAWIIWICAFLVFALILIFWYFLR